MMACRHTKTGRKPGRPKGHSTAGGWSVAKPKRKKRSTAGFTEVKPKKKRADAGFTEVRPKPCTTSKGKRGRPKGSKDKQKRKARAPMTRFQILIREIPDFLKNKIPQPTPVFREGH